MASRRLRTAVRSVVAELEFDRIAEMVAALAQTRAAANQLREVHGLPSLSQAEAACQLTRLVDALIEDAEGPLSFTGLDEALPWLDEAAPLENDPRVLLDIVRLADLVDTVRSRLQRVPELGELFSNLPDCRATVRWVTGRLDPDGTVPDHATPELARLRQRSVRLRQEVVAQLEAVRRAHASAVTDAPPTLRRGRYCLPVRTAARSQLPGLVLDTSATGATLFLEPFETVEANNALIETSARAEAEVTRILNEIAAAVATLIPALRTASGQLITLDAGQARARFGRTIEGRVVQPGGDTRLVLRHARHPSLDPRAAGLRRQLFDEPAGLHSDVVPLDFELGEGLRTVLISGPNAGGKTVVLKTLGVMVLMAFHGIPLPVADGSTVPAVSQLWTLIGDEQAVASDLSTFSASMTALATILARCDDSALVLIDELGTATDPLEGAALGAAVLETLTERAGLTVATTHLATLAQFAGSAEGMVNAAMEFDDASARPTYAIRMGRPGRSHALEIARATGLDHAVLRRAEELLSGDHLRLEQWLERLESLEGELVAKHAELAAERTEIAGHRDRLREARKELEHTQQRMHEELDAERSRLKAVAKKKLNAALAQLDAAQQERRHLGRRARERLREEALDLGTRAAPATAPPRELSAGDNVSLRGLGGTGVVEEIRGQRARVATRGKHIWLELTDLEREGSAQQPMRPLSVAAAEGPQRELKLIGMDAQSAREELERYLDRAWTSGLSSVRIVHGHGTGTLRAMVRDTCRNHPAVSGFRHPPQHRGGSGATEIDLANAEAGR